MGLRPDQRITLPDGAEPPKAQLNATGSSSSSSSWAVATMPTARFHSSGFAHTTRLVVPTPSGYSSGRKTGIQFLFGESQREFEGARAPTGTSGARSRVRAHTAAPAPPRARAYLPRTPMTATSMIM